MERSHAASLKIRKGGTRDNTANGDNAMRHCGS
jgi:hypothetical protein